MRQTALAVAITLMASWPASASAQMKGPDCKREGTKQPEFAYLVEVPDGKTAVFRFSKNAGGEVAGLLHQLEGVCRFHRSGNPDSNNKDKMEDPERTVEGPQHVWVTGWFKQPGWKHDAPWQQQRLKVISVTPSLIILGFEDRFGNPGTGGSEDWNDLEVHVHVK